MTHPQEIIINTDEEYEKLQEEIDSVPDKETRNKMQYALGEQIVRQNFTPEE